ncbi:DMT family transporter [Salipiger mucosus]|nr:DMT family transporter [Salipiger mucosus]
MTTRRAMDMAGAAGLFGFSTLLAFNQVVIKVTNAGFSPVFAAGLRSVISLAVIGLWLLLRRRSLGAMRRSVGGGLLVGLFFSAEFLMLFTALDLTTVARASIIFYSMPVWLALAAHFVLPGERLSPVRALGLGLAMLGVAWALYDPGSQGFGDWRGEALALAAALCWAGIALTLRLSRVSEIPPEGQLVWQLAVSALVLTAVAPLFGPVLRAPEALHVTGLVFQGVAVSGLGFLAWLFLLSRYRASDVAAFSFLSPVLAVGMGWALLDEPVGPGLLGALALVAVGVVLINRR